MTDPRWLSLDEVAQLFGYPSDQEVLALLYFRSQHWDDDKDAPTQDAINLGVVKRDAADEDWLWHYPFIEAVGVYWQVPGLQGITGYTSPAHAIDLVRQGIAQVVEANPGWAGNADERRERMGEDTYHLAQSIQDPEIFLALCAWEGLAEALEMESKVYVYLRSQVDREHPDVTAGLNLAESGLAMARGIGPLHPFVRYGLLSPSKPNRKRQPAQPLGEEARGIQKTDEEPEDWILKLKRYISGSDH